MPHHHVNIGMGLVSSVYFTLFEHQDLLLSSSTYCDSGKIHSFASFVGALFMTVFWDAPDPIKIVDSKQGWKKWQTSMKIKMLKQENVQKKTLKNCNVHLVLLFFPEKVSNEVSKCMTILDQTLSHSKFHTNLSINVKTKKHQFLPYNSMGPVKKFFLNKKICSPNRSVKSPSIWP